MGLSNLTRVALALMGLIMIAAAPPPTTTASGYNPREAFAPFDYGTSPSLIRSGSGLPGPDYWQNRADYSIRISLDPATHVIRGTAEIRYTNNSPDSLDVLWLQLEQNRFRPDSRGNLSDGRPIFGTTEGMVLDSVELVQGKTSVRLQPLISDPRAQLPLPASLAHGGTAVVRIAYHFT